MYYSKRYRRGFTLIEIMIVVAIIGLLAAMALPLWKKVRERAIMSAMDNDARQLASAAQQYFMEHSVSVVPVTYTNGRITGPLEAGVRFIGGLYSYVPPEMTTGVSFAMEHPNLPAARNYSPEGQCLP